MKKIFAIALALVMVLSMTVAFAASSKPGTCDWGTWDCTTYTSKCGVAHAEVVKFIRTNDCDPFVESDCAAVVKGERVYFGVKVVFDADVNAQWLRHEDTKLAIDVSKMAVDTKAYTKGTEAADPAAATLVSLLAAAGNTKLNAMSWDDIAKYVSGKTFWYTGTALVEEFDGATCVFEGYALSTGVKVCANVEYEWDGKGWLNGEYVQFGKYEGRVNELGQIVLIDKATKDVAVFGIGSGAVKTIEVGAVLNDGEIETGKVYNAYYNGKFFGVDFEKLADASSVAEAYAALSSDGDTCSFLPAMMQFMKLEFGTCVNDAGIKNFFGWDDDDAFKACVTWSKNASSIVDAECVVAIPKTGDASVLAWLF